MNFFRILIGALVVSLLLVGTAPVAAQSNETTEVPLGDRLQGDECDEPRAIDNNTVLCSARLEDGDAVLVLRSDFTQRITVTDAGAFMAGGDVPEQKATLREDERNTVRMPVTMVDGFAGVSIDTAANLFAVPLEKQQTIIGGPWSSGDTAVSALAASTSVIVVIVVKVIRYLAGRTTEPERVA
ncbi:ORF5 [Haloarcula hispanica pleomorphic virus 1]|uniref:ORF5 n=1 Tax=Haloarcula hispanica pleomorphic virus 1 TaxID=710112 RepID=D3JVC2_9VIRU|nr:unkown [Haloarcula hispanica pleomorphic virus 1]ADB79721.1 ORF5 [Haloarcula hispanica pleomorphic virus 1]